MFRHVLIFLFVMFGAFFVDGQDNIEAKLNKAEIVYDSNPAESYALCESAEREAIQSGVHSFDGNINLCKARYLILIASFEAAGKELNEAILYFEQQNDDANLIDAYSLKSLMLRKMGDLKASHTLLLEVLDLNKKAADQRATVRSLLNISLNYNSFGDADSMKITLDELSEMTDYFDAADYYYFYQNWGSYFLLSEDYQRAIQQYKAALEVAEAEEMTDAKATCLMFLSRAYRLDKNLNLANQFGEESYRFSQENNLIYESSEALGEWILVKKQLGDYKGALNIQDKWIKINKKIYDIEKIQKFKAMEGQLEIAQKEKQIAEGEIALKEANIKGQKARTRNAWLIGIVMIIALLLCFTAFIYVKTKKLNKTIQLQKEIVELKSLSLEQALENIEDSLRYSKLIQASMLPDAADFEKRFKEHFVFFRPKDIVSGDFYWLQQLENKLILLVGDCTGHGVPGAMVSMVCHEALNKAILEQKIVEPNLILDKVKQLVTNTFKRNENNLSDGMDASLVVLDGDTLHYAGANNGVWICRKKVLGVPEKQEHLRVLEGGECNLIELLPDKQPIGHYHLKKAFTAKQIQLLPGDKVILFSDGYADQFGGEKGKKLKVSNFKQIIAKSYQLSMQDQGEHLKNIFDQWKGEIEQLDDVCVIGFSMPE